MYPLATYGQKSGHKTLSWVRFTRRDLLCARISCLSPNGPHNFQPILLKRMKVIPLSNSKSRYPDLPFPKRFLRTLSLSLSTNTLVFKPGSYILPLIQPYGSKNAARRAKPMNSLADSHVTAYSLCRMRAAISFRGPIHRLV
jgi:hypothetical protein